MNGGYVARFAQLALGCVRKEYPNKLDHVLSNGSHVRSPRELHPAFYGCYDWHSSVHGHWLLVHLLRTQPIKLPEAEMRAILAVNLTAENLKVEDEYFRDPGRPSFERPYGWAWLLKLHEELYRWDDPDAARWFKALRPLAESVVAKYLDFFPRQKYPVRVGTHFNTAFGLAFAHDYAARLSLPELRALTKERACTYFLSDRDYPADFEPGGDDFLSPALTEADLMRRALHREDFIRWFKHFLPHLEHGEPSNLLTPAEVTDRTDPKLVHLDGLNLSRAWCLRSLAAAHPHVSRRRAVLADAAHLHAQATLPHVTSGDYAGEHWLATFAVYLLSTPAPRP